MWHAFTRGEMTCLSVVCIALAVALLWQRNCGSCTRLGISRASGVYLSSWAFAKQIQMENSPCHLCLWSDLSLFAPWLCGALPSQHALWLRSHMGICNRSWRSLSPDTSCPSFLLCIRCVAITERRKNWSPIWSPLTLTNCIVLLTSIESSYSVP